MWGVVDADVIRGSGHVERRVHREALQSSRLRLASPQGGLLVLESPQRDAELLHVGQPLLRAGLFETLLEVLFDVGSRAAASVWTCRKLQRMQACSWVQPEP